MRSINLEVSHTQLSNYSPESDRSTLPFTDWGCTVQGRTANEKAVPVRGSVRNTMRTTTNIFVTNGTGIRESMYPSAAGML